MFNRQERLNELERILTGEEKEITLQVLTVFWNEEKLESLKAREENTKIEDLENKIKTLIAKRVNVHPHLLRREINASWVEHVIYINGEANPLAYVNHKDKKVIIKTGMVSAFAKFNMCTRVTPQISVLSSETIDFDRLNQFSVTSANKIKADYEEMKNRVINRLMVSEKELLMSLVDNDMIKDAERRLTRCFVSESSEFSEYDWLVWGSTNSKNLIMREGGVLSEDLIFDFISNQPLWELIYEDLLKKNFLGEMTDVKFSPLVTKVYEEEIREKKFKELENNYSALRSREIVRALAQCGKTATFKMFGESGERKLETKYRFIESFYQNVLSEIVLCDGTVSEVIERISFRKKVLFDRAEFDKKYAHLK